MRAVMKFADPSRPRAPDGRLCWLPSSGFDGLRVPLPRLQIEPAGDQYEIRIMFRGWMITRIPRSALTDFVAQFFDDPELALIKIFNFTLENTNVETDEKPEDLL